MPTPNEFSRVNFGGDGESSYERRSGQGRTGNFEQARPEAGLLPEYGSDLVPTPSRSPQFSSDVNGKPEALLSSTKAGIQAHAELNQCYGLGQPIATLGSHPWLRDECAVTSTDEPANTVPKPNLGIPK